VPEQLTIAADIQVRLKMPEVKTLAAGRTTERHHVPVEQPRIAFKLDRCGQLGLRGAVDDGFLRQPFKRSAGGDLQVELLIRRSTGAIPLGGAGAGDLRPGVVFDARADIEPITTGNAARWVDDDVLADLGAFGVQMLLHPQRAEVTTHDRARAIAEARVSQFQLGMPARGKQGRCNNRIHGFVIIVRKLQIRPAR